MLAAETTNGTGAREKLDRQYIAEVEEPVNEKTDKVLHAEPLYVDLIRDLGARADEVEINLGMGISDKREFARFDYLAEIEWAPINRLGLELEFAMTDIARYGDLTADQPGATGLNSIKAATQYTWFVSEVYAFSSAVGYLHEFLRPPALTAVSDNGFVGNLYNPFFVAARRWGNNWHTLIYAGPRHIAAVENLTTWENNLSFHYMLAGTRHFVGIEMNQEIRAGVSSLHFRPQIRLQLTKQILVGIVTGVPDNLRKNGMSSFVRFIYELS